MTPAASKAVLQKDVIAKINFSLRPLLTPLSKLTIDPSNARRHPERSIRAIKESLKAFGQQKPIVIKDGIVIAGNGTVEAARELKWTHIAATEYDGSETSALGFKLADNRTADLSTFDEGVLKEQLTFLQGQDLDVELTAFWNPEEQADLFAGDDGIEQEDSDASMLAKLCVTIAEPKTKVAHGSVERMGPHTLVVADPVNEASLWLPHMKPAFIFAAYPGPYVALTMLAQEKTVLLVQPDVFIAGHIIDRWEEVNVKTKKRPK